MMDTINKMNATQFIDVLDGKENYIKKENVTLFLPSNEAFEKFSNHMLETVSTSVKILLWPNVKVRIGRDRTAIE